ncbi:hypothetical protein SDC9_137389 [bioreactor metagenome]|uniref:Uncharacterized protein n=1 Tax=bioreactor metagenome TaxID=1076179 RepID=A0A645DMF6_9ZZZZ
MKGDILGQRHRQVKAQGEVGFSLAETVTLLFGLAPALGQQHLRRLDEGGVQGGEAVERVGFPQDGGHALKVHLTLGQQLHKAG